MTKHPQDRRQRLAIKRRKYEEKPAAFDKGQTAREARSIRHAKEELQARETEDELRAAYRGVVA